MPAGINKEFWEKVSHLAGLRSIAFPRAVKPNEAVMGKPILMILVDDS
jgi:hypothetical protein